jgi:hypothetical protein
MAKRVILTIFLAVLLGGGGWLFAQEVAHHSISGGFNTGTIFTGGMVANYEYRLGSGALGITAQVGTRIFVVPQILAGIRWYPGGGDGVFHLDAKAGFSLASSIAVEGGLGWRIDPGARNGFFMDLSLVGGLPVVAGLEFALGFAF